MYSLEHSISVFIIHLMQTSSKQNFKNKAVCYKAEGKKRENTGNWIVFFSYFSSFISPLPKVKISSYFWIPSYHHHRCAYVQIPSVSCLSQMFPGHNCDTRPMSSGASFGQDKSYFQSPFSHTEWVPSMWPSSTFLSFLTMAAKRGSEQPPPIPKQGHVQQWVSRSPARSVAPMK